MSNLDHWFSEYLPPATAKAANNANKVVEFSRFSGNSSSNLSSYENQNRDSSSQEHYRYDYQERAALHEYESELSRQEAERRARESVFWDYVGYQYPEIRAEFERIVGELVQK